MTDYVTIKRSDIEALPKRWADNIGDEVIKVDDLRDLLDKAPSVEPYAYSWKVDYGTYKTIAFAKENPFAKDSAEHQSRFDVKPLYTSPPQAAENPNPLTRIMIDYIKGEEEFDTTPLESDHIFVKHFKSLVQMRRDEVKELEARIAFLNNANT